MFHYIFHHIIWFHWNRLLYRLYRLLFYNFWRRIVHLLFSWGRLILNNGFQRLWNCSLLIFDWRLLLNHRLWNFLYIFMRCFLWNTVILRFILRFWCGMKLLDFLQSFFLKPYFLFFLHDLLFQCFLLHLL